MFVADVHLGKLARLLRLLGFDTMYKNSYTNNDLINIASEQNKILLTRNASIYKNNGIVSFVIQTEDPEAQLKQVLDHFNLKERITPFSRCMVCNGILQITPKENIALQLPENTGKYFNEFWQCAGCNRIYWKGPHYNSMMALVNKYNHSF